MFTHQIHQIHQQYFNYTDSGQILKESVLFEPHGLKFHRNFPLVLKNKVNESPVVVDSNR